MAVNRISPSDLRWRVEPEWLVEQRNANEDHERVTRRLTEALQLALTSVGHRTGHVFVRGSPACDRTALIDEALSHLKSSREKRNDLVFMHNFARPDRPRLIQLPAGSASRIRSALNEMAVFVRDGLAPALESRPISNRLIALRERADAEIRRITKPLEDKLKPHGLVLVREEVGHMLQLTVNVQQTGRTVTQDDLANLVSRGQVSQKEFEQIRTTIRHVRPDLRELGREINRAWSQARRLRERMLHAECRRLLVEMADPMMREFKQPEVEEQLEMVIRDVLEKRVDKQTAHLADPELLYGANVLYQADAASLPVLRERMPTPRNLAGIIDPAWVEGRRAVASFHGIRAGSLVSAGTGFILLDAEELLSRPETIQLLGNAMAHGSVHLQSSTPSSPAISLNPDPVPVHARLIVTGTRRHWRQLGREHPDFLEFFAAPVDIPATFPRNAGNVSQLAAELRKAAEPLEPGRISDEALAALIEHAARLGGPGRLSRRMAELRRLLRQAALLARQQADDHIGAGHVHQATESARPGHPDAAIPIGDHSWYPARRHRVGQCWISASHSDGNRDHGQIVKVQASLAHGRGTRIMFSGLDHDPGPEVSLQLETLLTTILHLEAPLDLHALVHFETARQETPLVFDASMIYGAALVLLSRLSVVPLRQDIAVLGAVDGDGRLKRIDALNEQIEDAWRVAKMENSGTGGIIIPAQQRDSLMLCPALIQSASNQLFDVLTASSVMQTLELLTGTSPGEWSKEGFSAGAMLNNARTRLSQPVTAPATQTKEAG